VNQTSRPIEFRAMTPADIEAGLRLCRSSRWDQVSRDWARFLSSGDAGATAAVTEGRVIGTSARIRYGERFGWIGMVLVDPEAQGHGLGASLLKYSLDALKDLPAIRLDATPAGYPLYLKQGFIEEGRLRRMEGTPAIAGAMTEQHGTQPMTRNDLAEIARMDLGAFGAPRTELLEWMFEGAPELALVSRREGKLVGYLFGRHGFEFQHLGPVVALDFRTAAELTRACLSRQTNRAFIIDASCHDKEWLGFLEQTGFREQRPFIRMHRGGTQPFGEPQHQYAILGPEFG
jgi:GNAT superfamily N-acetyltransferase